MNELKTWFRKNLFSVYFLVMFIILLLYWLTPGFGFAHAMLIGLSCGVSAWVFYVDNLGAKK